VIFSKTTAYGIRAMVYLAKHAGSELCGLQEIAEGEHIPSAYLGKILGDLRKHQLLHSVKGIHGGYQLARPADEITLWIICEVLEPINENSHCILGLENCTSENKCSLDQTWNPLRKRFVEMLKSMSIAQIAGSLNEKGLQPGRDAA